jgi:hypothetical protein
VTDQKWEKISSEVAFHLIERHAEDWSDAGRMMEAWREATTTDLRKQLAEALLDAERAREERNREHVRLNAEWMAKCEELRKDSERYRRIRLGLSNVHGDVYAMVFAGDGDYPEDGDALDRAVDASLAKKEGA